MTSRAGRGATDRGVLLGRRDAVEQPDVSGDDLRRVQERARLAARARRRDPPFLHDKVVGLISAAGGTQGLQAINTMEFATRALRAWTSLTSFRSPRRRGSSTRTGRSRTRPSRRSPTPGPRTRSCGGAVRRGHSGPSRRTSATRLLNASLRPRRRALARRRGPPGQAHAGNTFNDGGPRPRHSSPHPSVVN